MLLLPYRRKREREIKSKRARLYYTTLMLAHGFHLLFLCGVEPRASLFFSPFTSLFFLSLFQTEWPPLNVYLLYMLPSDSGAAGI
jgi:hypothetical protein